MGIATHTAHHVQCWGLACEKPASQCETWSMHCHYTAAAQRPGGCLSSRQPHLGDAQDLDSSAAAARGAPHKHCRSPCAALCSHHSATGSCTLFGRSLGLPQAGQNAVHANPSNGPVAASCATRTGVATMPADHVHSGAGAAASHRDVPVTHPHVRREVSSHPAACLQPQEGIDKIRHDDLSPRGASLVLLSSWSCSIFFSLACEHAVKS